MPRLNEATLTRKDLVDAVRTVVRLKHRIEQRRELNDIENDLLEGYDKAVMEGRAYELDVASILEKA